MNDANLLDAFSAWTDESDPQAATADALTGLLRHDPAARRQLVGLALLESSLHRLHMPAPLPWWRHPRRLGGWPALILIVAALGGSIYWQRAVEPPAVDPQGPSRAHLPSPIEMNVTEGSPRKLNLPDGSMIVARPGSRLKVQPLDDVGSAYEVELRAGSADFQLIAGCRSFTVITPYGSVQAQGPRFTITVDTANKCLAVVGPLTAVRNRRFAGP
jgi:ferric-dicitrate binding protein FerR (iron transport regulator)